MKATASARFHECVPEHVPVQTQPSPLKRYSISTDISFREWQDEDPDGEWVKYTDARELLDRAGAALAAEKRSNAVYQTTVRSMGLSHDEDLRHIAALSKQVERRHDSTCSREGERAVDCCPECQLGGSVVTQEEDRLRELLSRCAAALEAVPDPGAHDLALIAEARRG